MEVDDPIAADASNALHRIAGVEPAHRLRTSEGELLDDHPNRWNLSSETA